MKLLSRSNGDTRLRIVLRKGHDGFIVAECTDIPGCLSQGRDQEEALRNIKDAIGDCLDAMLTDFIRPSQHDSASVRASDEREIRVTPSLELLPV